MAAKKKSVLNSVLDTNAPKPVSTTTNTVVETETTAQEDVSLLKSEIARLNEVNSTLIDNMSKYLEEIERLKKANSKPVVNSNVTDNSNEINELNAKIADLRTECDMYLVKISELTFENAKLKYNIENISNNANGTVLKKDNTILEKPRAKPRDSIMVNYQNPYRNNGYSNWN